MSYNAVAAALVTKLKSGTSLTRVYPTPLINPTPPCILLVPQAFDYDATMRGGMHLQQWTARLLLGKADAPTSLADIYDYMAPTGSVSIKAAIETDPTLGGVVDSVRVTGHSEPGFYDYGSGTLLGVEFTIHVAP